MTFSERSAGPAFRQALTRVFPRMQTGKWLSVAAMLADVAFETDRFGRFTAFGQNSALGIPTTGLLGSSIADFCRLTGNGASAASSFSTIFATLSREGLAWRGLVTLPRGDGGESIYQIFLAPKPADEPAGRARAPSESGGTGGAYGLLVDRNAPEFEMPASPATGTAGLLDAQTGLWAATAFELETARRFDRLDVEGLPGTMMLLGFSRTPSIGHNAVAMRLAQDLREVSRPTDIIGRINGTTFALWCDGMDDLTGAERAAKFCQRLPATLPGNPCISVGLVARWPGGIEEPQGLIKKARMALQQAQRLAHAAAESGSTEAVASGTWRVWNPQS